MHPVVDSVLFVLLAGFICRWVRDAPAIDPPFKSWAVWLISLGAAFGVLSRLGVVSYVLRRFS